MRKFKINRALSIRQPFVDMILKGTKKIEYRTIPTKIVGEPFFIYATLKVKTDVRDYSENKLKNLPTGLLVATAKISKCVANTKRPGEYKWHLTEVKRIRPYLIPKRMAQPVWFKPF